MFSNIFAYVTAGAMAVSSLSSCAPKNDTAKTDTSVTVYAQFTAKYSDKDLENSYDESSAVKIAFSDSGAVCDGNGVSVDGASVKITKGGVYIVSGTTSNGSVTIETPDSDKVRLVLDNADITSSDGAAINEISCDKLFITLVGDNKISDSENYTFEDGEDEPNGAIFAKHDMTINGGGLLTVNGVYKHGIVSKDDLKITGGTISVTSADDGIRGRDSVLIKDGNISVISGGDGIKSNNDSGEEKGRISIDGGNVNITAEKDGIQAESVLQINGGALTVNAGDINAEVKSDRMGGGMPMGGGRGNHGGMPDQNGTNPDNMPQPPQGGERTDMQNPPDGNMPDGMTPPDMPDSKNNRGGNRGNMPPQGERKDMQNPPDGNMPDGIASPDMPTDNNAETEQTSDSKKAIKSTNAIYINNGTLNLYAEDDTVHADAAVEINGGTLTLSTADDGIHADYATTINGGTIDIVKCYEGVEGKAVVINGGDIKIKAEDDAVNAADPDVKNAQPGRGDDEIYIEINGGTLYAVSGFDTLDSNGNIFINGGTVTLDGPTNGMDCAIDYDGKAYVNGGTINASGVSSSTFAGTSKQASLAVVFSSSITAGTEVTLCDSNGNILAQITPTQRFGGVLFSNDKIKQGETYTVKAGDVSVTVEQSSQITAVNQDGSAVSGGGMHGGGMPPQGGHKDAPENDKRHDRRSQDNTRN